MNMDSGSSETSLTILINRDRLKIYWKLYWRTLVIFLTPLIFMPVAFASDKNAYKCFYVFLVTIVYWSTDVLHPGIVALLPVAAFSVMGSLQGFFNELYVRNELLDSVGVLMIVIGIEYSRIHRRIAVKLLLIFGCSHYRLSFLLFFTSMFLSMWISNVMGCGIMMPLVKAILLELEKMGILDVYTVVGKSTERSNRHELVTPRPTLFTIFYFLGIAYSSSIGGISTIMGSETNQIFKMYCETLFPEGPKIEFPHFMLLNLPGVLVMETLLYFWLNFYFLGMFRGESDIALEVGLTDEEAQYISTLLATQYEQMGKVKFHEVIVGVLTILACVLQATLSVVHYENEGHRANLYNHYKVSSPCFLSVFLLCIAPVDLQVLNSFRRQNNGSGTMPQNPSKACLNWELIKNNLDWSVLFIVGGSGALFEALKDSHMIEEMETFLLVFKSWPAQALALVVIVFCQILTQFAPNACVAYCLLPSIAKLSIVSDVNPHYLMVTATLASSMPFHLVTGTPVNAMVCAYAHIPPWKMMSAGIGPTVTATVIVWFTVVVWSTAVWTDINQDPSWADTNVFKRNF